MNIFVFKTNLTDAGKVSDIGPDLDVHPHIIEWNVDLNDSDNILRVVSRTITPGTVEKLLLDAGYYCEELQ